MNTAKIWGKACAALDKAYATSGFPDDIPTLKDCRYMLEQTQTACAALQALEQLLMGIKPPSTKP